jgi:hypothetical protein
VIDARRNVRVMQSLIGESRPALANVNEFLAVIRQLMTTALEWRHVESGFGAESRRRHFARRGQQVRVKIARIPIGSWLVHRKIDRDLVTLGNFARKGSGQPQTLSSVELNGETQLVLASDAGVMTLLSVLRGVPQSFAVARPGNVHAVKLRWQQDLGVQDIAPPAVLAVALRVHLETLLQALLDGKVCSPEEVRDFVRELERDALQYSED